MRLIDADAVVTIQTYDEMYEEYDTEKITIANALDKWADEGCPPTIDAVPVVRCKDCKFARREEGMPKGYRKCVNIINEGNNQWRSTNDFCSYGWEKGESNWIKENK